MAEIAVTGDIAARLDWEMDAKALAMCEAAIEDLCEDARHYGLSTWTTAENTPNQVASIVKRAVKRYMDNSSGYNTSRSGDETVGWSDKAPQVASGGTPEFTKSEIEVLRMLAGNMKSGFHSVPVTGYGDPDRIMQRAPKPATDPDGGKGMPYPSEDPSWAGLW